MALPISYYVNITSGVGAAEQLGQRQLIPMLFDDNALIPTSGFVNFPNNNDGAANVAAYFGSSSEEYKRAAFAFGWISKNIQQVPSISFGRWNSAASAPRIYGDGLSTTKTIATWQAITSGALDLTMGSFTFTMSSLNFSSVTTLANVATVIQTAIQSETGGGALWTGATVTYNATAGRFELLGGATGTAPISVTVVGSDVADNLGWESVLTILSAGAGVQTITDCINNMANLNNNFGSFTFIAALTTLQVTEAATVNHVLNNMFLYSIPTTAANASTIQAAVGLLGGCCTTLTANTTQYEEQIPMMILGATNYANRNSVQNYMFQQFAIQPTVTDVTTATAYDNIGVNYYANTQQAGQIVSLYQRGIINGISTDPRAMNTYANEIWLKGSMQSALMNLLLALSKISANAIGQSQVLAICQSVLSAALNNGTISVGRTLTATEKLYITNATGDANAWQQVQNIGYWITTTITTFVVDNVTQYAINYTLIYAEDNVVTKIIGTDILI